MFCGWRYKRSHEICPLVFADYSDEEGNYFCFEVSRGVYINWIGWKASVYVIC